MKECRLVAEPPDRAEREGQVSARCAMATRGIYGLRNCRRKNENYSSATQFYHIGELERLLLRLSDNRTNLEAMNQRTSVFGIICVDLENGS